MRTLAFIAFILLSLQLEAQNLVPNSSFEEYSDCPNSTGEIELALGWTGISGWPDYYHECGTNGLGVPVNRAGGGYARTGQAYSVVALWSGNAGNGRYYLFRELSSPLSAGISYHAEFYVTMLDSLWYATKNIGIHFSSVPYSNNVNEMLNHTPQVSYSDTGFLDNKIRWVGVSGSFTAAGGERYLAIGNFDSDFETDTAFVQGGGSGVAHPVSYWHESGYFIDDVSLVPDSIYLTMDDVETQEGIELYPNPNAGEFTIQLAENEKQAELFVWDVSGKMVLSRKLVGGENLVRSELSAGLYLYGVLVNGVLKRSGKVSVFGD